MQHKSSSLLAVGLAVSSLMGLLLVGYVGAYWWRLSDYEIAWSRGNYQIVFPTRIETVVFYPAWNVHAAIHPDSLNQRLDDITNERLSEAYRKLEVKPEK